MTVQNSPTRRTVIPVAGPSITELEIAYVTDAVTNAWYEGATKFQEKFQHAFGEYVGRKHALALPSCTSALHLSVMALGISPGDEVIVPDCTWTASVVPITYCGATPVFVDIDPDTWCISVDAVEAAITPRTKAVIAVDLYGGMPDMVRLEALCKEHGLALIEDAAEAIGSMVGTRQAGSFGNASVFSFHGTKTLTTSEGGMFVTDDDKLFHDVLVLHDLGREPGDRSFFTQKIGWKYKMSSMQAALGLAQTERIEELIAKKRQTFGWYQDRLGNRDDLQLNAEPANTRNTYWMNTVVVDPSYGIEKRELIDLLANQGVSARPFFYPLSMLPAYAHIPGVEKAALQNVNSYNVSATAINLPSALDLNEEEVAYSCEALLTILSDRAKGKS